MSEEVVGKGMEGEVVGKGIVVSAGWWGLRWLVNRLWARWRVRGY